MKKLVQGVGINDATYAVQVKGPTGRVWCPFYRIWTNMLQRCYSSKWHASRPTYIGCTVVEEWKTFSVFKKWVESQPWEGNDLDKDLLVHGNKVYGPDTCVFVSPTVNVFVIEQTANKGEWPIGVYYSAWARKFHSQCRNPFTKKKEHLGYFDCPQAAHQAWLHRKRELAILLAAEQADPRVAKALVDRYAGDAYNPLHE